LQRKIFAVFCRFEFQNDHFLPFLPDWSDRENQRQTRHFERKKSGLQWFAARMKN